MDKVKTIAIINLINKLDKFVKQRNSFIFFSISFDETNIFALKMPREFIILYENQARKKYAMSLCLGCGCRLGGGRWILLLLLLIVSEKRFDFQVVICHILIKLKQYTTARDLLSFRVAFKTTRHFSDFHGRLNTTTNCHSSVYLNK